MTIKFINGKFTAQRLTGVQRAASCLVCTLDQLLSTGPSSRRADWVLLCPPNGIMPTLRHIAVRHVGPPGLPLHLWEQLLLPLAARSGSLISLAGSAPLLARRPRILMHDAAVFDWPQAYTRTFVFWYRNLFRCLARGGAGLLTVSQYSRRMLTAALRVSDTRIDVVTLGCDHLDDVVGDDTITARQGLTDKRYFLAVASDNPTKNIPALIAAFSRLQPDEDVRLVIVGERNASVFRAAEAREAAPDVVRTGRVSDAELKSLYQGAIALVYPSLYEGFGLPPLEAMACGCPVIAAREASLPEVCGDAALYVDPLSQDALVAAMRAMLDDGALRERLRSAGKARAAGFSWTDSARALLGKVGDREPA